GEYNFQTKFYGENSFRIGSNIGLFDRLTIGFSYGADNFVGDEKPEWYEHVDFKAKFQLLTETLNIPQLSVGFDSEGHGSWSEELERYTIKSKGFYAVIAKHDMLLKGSGMLFGLNRSMEDTAEDRDLNAFVVFNQQIGEDLNFIVEYDCAFNDNDDQPSNELEKFGSGKGYLNFSASWYLIPELQFRFSAFDLLDNSPESLDNSEDSMFDRAFEIIYTTKF
ncbi:MAG: hypothetical protein B6226_04370, partial [Candidatus Cloacimonetes bacterium 4572_65]